MKSFIRDAAQALIMAMFVGGPLAYYFMFMMK